MMQRVSHFLFGIQQMHSGFVHNWESVLLTLSTFITISIVCLARGDKQSSTWVWTNFEPSSGWPPVVSFFTGLTTHAYMFGGLDSALHLAEETLDASRTVPKALMSTIGIGFFSGFVFSVAMTYCIPSLDIFANDPSVSHCLCSFLSVTILQVTDQWHAKLIGYRYINSGA